MSRGTEAKQGMNSTRGEEKVTRTIRKKRGNNWSKREGKGGNAPPGSEKVCDLMDIMRWTMQEMDEGEVAYWYRDNTGERRLWFMKIKSIKLVFQMD